MIDNDSKDSVRNEQFGKSENTNENTSEEKTEKVEDQASSAEKSEKPQESATPSVDETVASENSADNSESVNTNTEIEASEKPEQKEVAKETAAVEEVNETPPPVEDDKTAAELEKSDDPPKEKETSKEEDAAKVEEKTPPIPEDIDFTTKSKEELLDLLKIYLSEYRIEKIKRQVDIIKSNFYKLHNAELEDKKKHFIEEGGLEQDFKVEESPVEITMKELLNEYRDKRQTYTKNLESEKETNLNTKYEIIDSIKDLINSQESLNKTFHDFRNLQERWREVGPVPQGKVKDLWEKYHYYVEAFYDYIKINKELRDLDFKKNLEAKLKLCERAEELLLEPSVVEAFRKLQVLHDQWREIGPVPADKRSDLWERFKEATSKINHKHQEYFVKLKEEQKKNLQEKSVLCEKAEELAAAEPETAKDWEEKSKELIELQKIWKTIGFAPKKHNTKIYERFRAACDIFFNKKREFFAHNREEQENNLQLKTELCIQAEAIAESTDWKKTTDELIKLQKRWKTIGPVPIKQSDKIWKRFRAACDNFFNNKSEFYSNIDSTYKDNLKLKEQLLEEIEAFKEGSDVAENLKQLKDFQRRWAEIGFVPIKQKDTIQEKYRELLNTKFDQLKLNEDDKALLKFRSKIENIASKPNANRRLSMERDKCFNKLKQLENDITLWENNIGFFSNSKNAESMITDVERKIKDAQNKIEILNEKLNILDEFEN